MEREALDVSAEPTLSGLVKASFPPAVAWRPLDVISRSQLTSQTLKYLFLDSKAGRQLNPEGRLV
jgi:hypothetical protein